jgi:hypothetical protein
MRRKQNSNRDGQHARPENRPPQIITKGTREEVIPFSRSRSIASPARRVMGVASGGGSKTRRKWRRHNGIKLNDQNQTSKQQFKKFVISIEENPSQRTPFFLELFSWVADWEVQVECVW